MYSPEDYQVTEVNSFTDGSISSFKVNIKGAEFTVHRVMNHFRPTPFFAFNTGLEFAPDGTAVEIGWSTCDAGMIHLAEQISEVGKTMKYQPNFSVFSYGKRKYHFIEVEV